MTRTRIDQGEIEGRAHGGVLRFAGIPYAAPVDGARRFLAPAPPDPWRGVRVADSYGPIAPQFDFMAMMLGAQPEPQSEDCLFLNVFTPAVDDARRPVMVWIHGGAFVLGSGSAAGYDGSYLAARGDVVVVTLNYRLGALGFLHLADVDPAYPDSGNLGILDQIAALTWVRDNIAAFGGDPDNVTIFGESAGGMSVGTLLGTPAARGLFHKAIPQSGAAHNASPAGHAAEVAQQFLAHAGVTSVAQLQALSAQQIVDLQQAFTMAFFTDVEGQMGASTSLRLPFQPVVDGRTLPEAPIDAVVGGSAADVPVLVGTCLDEWNLFSFLDTHEVDDAHLERRFSKLFGDGAAAVAVYRDEFPDLPPKSLFGAAVTDAVFRQPAIRLAEALVANGSPTFSYLFTWPSPGMGGAMGCCHALDVPFVFGDLHAAGLAMLLGPNPPASLVDAFQESWLAFARTGDPSNDVTGPWPSYDTDRRATMRLDLDAEVVDDPERPRRELWASLL